MEENNQIQSNEVQNESSQKNSFSFFSTNWKYNRVKDQEAPVLYSRLAIYLFTCLCSVIFGGILMAINLKIVNKKEGILEVLLYSIIYTVLMFLLLSQIPRNTLLTLLLSMLGSFALYNYFWKKYIGVDTKYRTKPIWTPLIIAIIIFSLLILVSVIGQRY